MFDQLIGLLLVGLGIKTTPQFTPSVKGDSVVAEDNASLREARKAAKTDIKEMREAKKASRSADGVEYKKRLNNLNEVYREKKAQLREEVKEKRVAAKEEHKERRAAYKEKIQEFRDTKKIATIERIDGKMATLNTKRTDQMTQHLNKMQDVMAKLVAKVGTLKADGVDTAAVDTAITEAQSAIAAAHTAVSDQAGKDYVIEISEESTAKNDVGEAMSTFKQELAAVHETVVTARKALSSAIAALEALL